MSDPTLLTSPHALTSDIPHLWFAICTSKMSAEGGAGEQSTLPSRPKEGEDGAAGPSKSALKKAAKDKEKAANNRPSQPEKAAKRKEAEDKQKAETAANDTSRDDYGDLPLIGSASYKPTHTPRTTLQAIAAKYTESTSLAEETGGPSVVFRAVVENAREQSAKLTFLVLGFKLDTIQAVVAASDTLSRQMVKFAKNISAQSQVLVHGLVKKPRDPVKSATIGHLEIHITRLFVIARAETPLPVQVEDCEQPLPAEDSITTAPTDAAQLHGEAGDPNTRPTVSLSTRLTHRPVDLRAKLNHAIFTIKDGIVSLFTSYLHSRDFLQIQTPKLLGAPSEGGASVFEVSYFAQKAYLAQSPQLYKQMLIAAQFERVFEVSPVFRAENSNTARHLTEFTGLDLEMTIEESYTECIDLVEDLMLHIFEGLRSKYAKETELVRKSYNVPDFKIPAKGQVPRLRFAEGVAMLRAAGAEMGDFDDLSTAQEKLLGRLVLERYGSDFYVLDQYPLAVRPFYTMPSSTTSPPTTPPKNPAPDPDPTKQYSNSYDFHMRGVEILSGAQRIHSHPLLSTRMSLQSPPLNPSAPGLKEYTDSFRYGCPPHAGAGLGLERITMLWLGLPNVRLGSAFPRDPGRLVP
ncbi:MAG: hypothetical protein M1828_006165 [Chrysothrix sp. TS-e1954]|nr:MAG: hypothetical protein M1828_006165 [Chrysothrix sp. TS-e1954]